MVIGYYSEGYSRYMLECRDKQGNCLYRKFTDEDRMNVVFNAIQPTTEGHRFRCTPLEDGDKKKPPIADDDAVAYIQNKLAIAMGMLVDPTEVANAQIIADHQQRDGVVLERLSNKKLKSLQSKLVKPVPSPEIKWKSVESQKTIREKVPAANALPAFERAEGDFDMEEWASSGIKSPQQVKDEALDQEEAPKKRGPGRPRKNPASK